MNAEQYRVIQEDAYSGHEGTTEGEVFAVISWLPFGLFLYNRVIQPRLGTIRQPILEFIVLILPQLLLFLYPHLCILTHPIALLLGFLLVGRGSTMTKTAIPQGKPRLPHLTCSRAASMLMCTLGVLAVDFKQFPRRFAKTETFGVSLVGGYIGVERDDDDVYRWMWEWDVWWSRWD